MYALRLYVSGRASGVRAERTLSALCEAHLAGRYELEVIDVFEHPERAEAERIFATPTLVRVSPPPVRRLVGDLSDRQKVLAYLELDLEVDVEAGRSSGGEAPLRGEDADSEHKRSAP
ncbi:MAG: circadian clock protein KaiB [Solirubrobacteraceae bacterium]|jgi:circadian clock protein KaiB|nr:circadian clock protein KaiB [Solirubrobacteraceae bacterium]